MKRFSEASHILQFAQCFCVQSVLEGQSIRDAFWTDSYNICRENLNAIPEGSDEASLFGFNPNTLLPIQFQPKDFFIMTVWIRTLSPIESFVIPVPKNDNGEILP